MDMVYSAPVNYDSYLVIHVIDDEWINDTLPVEDAMSPASAVAPVDDDDSVPPEDDEDDKWTDLGIIFSTSSAPVSEIR